MVLHLFLGLFSFFYKSILCLLRTIRNKEDGLNAIVSGFIASFALLFERKSKRVLFATFLIFRALDSVMTHVDRNTSFKKVKHAETLLFAISTSFLGYMLVFGVDIFPKGVEKFVLTTVQMGISEWNVFYTLGDKIGIDHWYSMYGIPGKK